ncbi:Down syndrome cell adhesion molecule-like protein Dscam2 [Nymphon striatum]|nr:Down syndrome cell adhesion molecule-like protein Dscam2 [Nymphon striatum]
MWYLKYIFDVGESTPLYGYAAIRGNQTSVLVIQYHAWYQSIQFYNVMVHPSGIRIIQLFLSGIGKLMKGYGYSLNQQGPIFIYEPPTELTFLNTKGAVVDCLAHGYPDPVIEWITEDNVKAVAVPGILRLPKNGSLIFEAFESDSYHQPIHARVYRCSVSNLLGRILSRRVRVRAGK